MIRMSLEPLQCPICLDPLRGLPTWKEVLSTPCGHLFCNTCLVTALRYWLGNCSNYKGIKLFLATGAPGNAQRAGEGPGLTKPLRFSCRFHVLEFMSDLSILFDGSSVYNTWITS